MRFPKAFVFLALITIGLSGLTARGEPQGEPAESLPVLRIGYSSHLFPGINKTDIVAATRVWAENVLQKRGLAFQPEIHVFETLAELFQACRNSQLDIVALQAVEYLALRREIDLEGISVSVGEETEGLRACLLVRQDARIQRLEQLSGCVFKMETAAAGEVGPLWLDTILMEHDLPRSGEFFSIVQRVYTPSKAVLPVFFGQAEACLVRHEAFSTMTELNPQLGRELKILRSSPVYVSGLLCFLPSFKHPDRERVRQSVLSLEQSAPGRQIMELFRTMRILPFDESRHLSNILELRDRYKEAGGADALWQ